MRLDCVPGGYDTPYVRRLLQTCSPENQADLVAPLEHLAARKRKPATACMYVLVVATFDRLAGGARLTTVADPATWTRLVAAYAADHSIASVQTNVAVLKSVIAHANDGQFPRGVKAALSVGRAKTNRDLVPITEDERDALLRAAGAERNRTKAARDQALIWLLWDSGFRIGEALSLNVESVRLDDQQGAHLVLPPEAEGFKTGPRTIYVVESVPALKVWLAFHRRQLDPHAPLFYGGSPEFRIG